MKNIIQWKPFSEFDRLMDSSMLSAFPRLGLDLAIDLYEEKDKVVAKMSLPGIDASNLDVSIEDDMLTVTGSREEEYETDEKDYYSKEIRRGSFTRSVSLPSSVEASKAEASYKDGVLTISMPSIPGSKKKAVKIKVA